MAWVSSVIVSRIAPVVRETTRNRMKKRPRSERDKATRRIWSANNRQRENAHQQSWRLRNPEKNRLSQKKWRDNNKDHRRQWEIEWRSKNRLAYNRRKRVRALQREFGLSESAYHDMLSGQGGACAICRKTYDYYLCVDHDHSTGAIRGLLCKPCNMALGMFKDDEQILRSALNYLMLGKQMEELA